jgi:hypothetical protein
LCYGYSLATEWLFLIYCILLADDEL